MKPAVSREGKPISQEPKEHALDGEDEGRPKYAYRRTNPGKRGKKGSIARGNTRQNFTRKLTNTEVQVKAARRTLESVG